MYRCSISVRHKRQASYSYIGRNTRCKLVVVADHFFFNNVGRNDKFRTSGYIVSTESFTIDFT